MRACSDDAPGGRRRRLAADRTVTYTFTASQPGTYLYESGTNPHKQVHMGLYGALVVRPTGTGFGPNFAYNDARRSSTRPASTWS